MKIWKNHYIIDMLFLYISCLSLLSLYPWMENTVIIVLLSMIIDSLIMYIEKSWSAYIGTLLFLGLSYWYPPMIVFLPLSVYEFIRRRQLWGLLLIPLALVMHHDMKSINILILCVISLIGGVLSWRTKREMRINREYLRLRDDMVSAQLELERKNQELLEKQDYEIYTATLNERTRIAREIHDHVGHQLSSSILQIGALEAINQDEVMKLPLHSLKETLNHAMNDIRSSVHDLHDESLDLNQTLLNIIEEFKFCEVTLEYDVNSTLDRSVIYGFLAIVKEALNNVHKHSDAKHVNIIIREHPRLIQLIIHDDGSVQSHILESGIGLHNMEERIQKLKGQFHIRQQQGFEIFISVPKEEAV